MKSEGLCPSTQATAPWRPLFLLACVLMLLGLAGCNGTLSGDETPPVITSLMPDHTVAGSPGFTLTVIGTGFTDLSQVNWNGGGRNTTFVNSSHLTAVIASSDVQSVGEAIVTVVNQLNGSSDTPTSMPAFFEIQPGITSLSPASAAAGGPAFTLTVNGFGFVSNSVVNWNGSGQTTTFVSATRLTAVITASDIADPGAAMVIVANPEASGGASAPATFTVSPANNPVPTITSLSPSSIGAGSGGFTLAVIGSNFVASSVVQWNGSSRSTTVFDSTQLSAAIAAADVATASAVNVTVLNPAPAGGASNAATFTVTSSQAVGIVDVISMNDAGQLADGTKDDGISLSSNGRYAAFSTHNSSNLVSNPPVSQSVDVYLHDSCVGSAGCSMTTQLASAENGIGVSSGGGAPDGNGSSFGPTSISGDGRFVAFLSDATTLVPTANFPEAYVRDTCLGARGTCMPGTAMVSLTDSGSEPNSSAHEVALSAQGRFVAFVSDATDVVPNVNVRGMAYLRDTCQGTAGSIPPCTPFTALVSADNNGNPASDAVTGIAISAGGRFVSFASRAGNLPGALAGATQIYVRDTCINLGFTCTPSTSIVSVDNSGNSSVLGDSEFTSISDDGRVVAFISFTQLTSNSINNNFNLFVRDTCQTEFPPVLGCGPSTMAASVATDGSTANGPTNPNGGLMPIHSVSGTGRFVVFSSTATNLVPGGTPANGVFVRDTCIGAASICAPSTILVSRDSSGNFMQGFAPAISSDGHYCAFLARKTSPEASQDVLALTGF